MNQRSGKRGRAWPAYVTLAQKASGGLVEGRWAIERMRAEFDDRARRAAKELEGSAGGAGRTPGTPGVEVCNRVREILGLPQTDVDGNEIETVLGWKSLPGYEPGSA